MGTPRQRRSGPLAQLGAFATLAWRYALTIHPLVEHEIEHWTERARRIAEPHCRALALAELRETAAHARLNATAAALAPRRHREHAVKASVALQLAYDYLDGVTERKPDIATALTRYADLGVPFEDDEREAIGDEYVRDLLAACRRCFRALPSCATVAPLARSVAARTAATQARGHASPPEDFMRWVESMPRRDGLAWWEAAAGWTAGVVVLHALIALAATDEAVPEAAAKIAAAYERIAAVATLGDSLVDRRRDARSNGHSYVGYYESPHVAGARIGALARDAMTATAGLPHAAHHAMTVSGVLAYYVTDPDALGTAIPTAPVEHELGVVLAGVTASFRLLRRRRRSLFPS